MCALKIALLNKNLHVLLPLDGKQYFLTLT